MRYVVILVLWLLPQSVYAQLWEDQKLFELGPSDRSLKIISSTDTSFLAPVIESFLQENPGVSVEYLVIGTADIDRIFRDSPHAYDLVISSAMDLQFKLANDGYALKLNEISLPSWAQWRQSLFAFTSEPAAIVVNRTYFTGEAIPETRQELIQALRDRFDLFRNRVGTYDVRRSGLGYLFATQDARASDTFWRLMEVMGSLEARLYCCSGDMIDDLVEGKIAMAYNVLGSYATARAETHDVLEVILPSDFPTNMMRTAMVSKSAPLPELAEAFVTHLIREQSATSSNALPLPPLRPQSDNAEFRTIPLEPALLTYLDTLKRRNFLEEWESAIIQTR